MSLQLGADYSTYIQPEITQTRANAFRAAGIERMCLALDTAPETFNSARALHAAGIALDGYRELGGPADYVDQTQRGIQAFAPLAAEGIYIRRYWLTAEDTSVGERPDILVPAFLAAIRAASGWDVGVYSGSWYWPDYMGDDTRFSAFPLWHAAYDNNPVIEPVSYGGWTIPNAHQYATPVVVDGIGLDLDVWWVDDVEPPPPPPPGPDPGPNVRDAILHLETALAELRQIAGGPR